MSDHYFMDNLQLPGARAISALSYYHSETWPKIAQMITTHLSNQNASCSVAPMIEVGDEEFFKPWIIVRVIPAERNPGMPLDHEIKNLMIENGYLDPQYNVHIESGKCAARSITTKAFARDFKMFDGYNYNGGGGTTAHGGRNFYGRKHNNSSARSVKHLTCWYWLHSQAGCNKTDDSCLYSHSDTGRYADQPRPAFPGGRAVAGRNAQRLGVPHPAGLTNGAGLLDYPPLIPTLPNSDCNLGSGLASAAYEKDGGHGHIGSFAEPLPSDLAYSPPPPDDDRSIRTPSYAGMIPASVERLGGAILSERVEAMKIGSDDTTPLITVENTTTDKVIYGPTYIHPNRTNIGPSKLAQPPRSVSAGELNGDDNNNNNNGDMKKETPQYSPFDKRSKFKHHGASTKDTPPVKGREKRKYEFKNPSSGPAPLNRTDPVSLMYSNMHTVMAARELCIGLDNDIRNLDNLENQMGTLTDVLRGVLDQYGINRGDESISKIGYELDIVTDNVKSAANKARGQRKRAESIMKTEDNARHVFGWPAPKKVDPVATTTADDASAAAAGIIIQKGDVEAEAEGEVEGGVGLGGSK